MGEQWPGALRWLALAVAVGIFVVVEALLLRATWRSCGGGASSAHPPPVRVRHTWELLWTLLPALGLLVLTVAGVRALLGG